MKRWQIPSTVFLLWLVISLVLAGCSPAPEADVTTNEQSATAVPDTGPTTAATPTGETAVASLPPLPALGGSAGMGGGMGGGGGMESSIMVTDAITTDIMMPMWNPLEGVAFTLNTSLPTDPASAAAYELPATKLFTTTDVERLAASFGLNGTIYTEIMPVYETPPDAPAWQPPTFYYVFDGQRQLSVYDANYYYYDQAVANQLPFNPMPYEQAAPIAEAFLKERGLLDFTYQVVKSSYSQDVEFRRVVDGLRLNNAEYIVTITAEGQIMSVSASPFLQATNLGSYPLRSAADAWQLAQEHTDYNLITYFTYPGPDYVSPVPEPAPMEELYRYWPREYQEGETINLYFYPTVYQPVNGNAAPRIQGDQFLISAADDVLQSIATQAGKQLQATGIVHLADSSKTLEIISWQQAITETYMLYPMGLVRLADGQTLLDGEDGQTYLIPNAPTDLAAGEHIAVSAWDSATNENGYVVLNWLGIDRIVDNVFVEPAQPEVGLENPYQIHQITIDQVELVYTNTWLWDEAMQTSRMLVQPAWHFKGMSDTLEIVEIMVQAVSSEYVQPMP